MVDRLSVRGRLTAGEWFAIALMVVAFVVPAAVFGWLVFRSTPPNPVLDRDFPDPMVVVDGSTYFAFATGVGDANLQLARSTDLRSWETLADPLPRLPGWDVGGQAWGPTVVRFDSTWVLYFSAAIDYSGTQCIHTATADSLTGPYEPTGGDPLLCDGPSGGVIDPSVVQDGTTSYLLWKVDGNHLKKPTFIRSQPLDAQGTGFASNSSPSQLLTDTEGWEKGIVEAPWMVANGSDYALFYSGALWSTSDYAIGWARCDSPTGPCTNQSTDAPLVGSRGAVAGPGSASLFTDAVGDRWIAYHAWNRRHVGYPQGKRTLHLDRITISGDAPSTDAPTGR